MKLSQNIIFYRLFTNYPDRPIRFFNRGVDGVPYGYPILYEAGADLSDHVVIIRTDDLEAHLDGAAPVRALFVCVGEAPEKRPDMPPVILIGGGVSLVGVNNYLIETYDRFETWDRSLADVVRNGGSFQDLVDCCRPVLGAPVTISDHELRTIAMSGPLKRSDSDVLPDDGELFPNGSPAAAMGPELDGVSSLRESYLLPSAGGFSLCRNLFMREEFSGRIAVHLDTEEENLRNYCDAVLEHLCAHAGRLLQERTSSLIRKVPENRLAALLRQSLNKKRFSEKLWEEAFLENGWDMNGPYALVQFVSNSMEENSLKITYPKILDYKALYPWVESLCFVYMDHPLLFINLEKSFVSQKPDLVASLSDFSKDHFLIAGASRYFIGIEHLRSAYEQTQAALEYGTANCPSDSCHVFNDYALDYMLRHCVGTFDSREICSHKLASLLRYDTNNGTDYFNTLYTYFKCRFNAAEAAKKLFINRSTFHYRLERIQELVYIDFDSEDERLYLAISFRIMKR